jgi:hypothetical protein
MAKVGRKKTPVTIFNPRGESPSARKKRIASERRRYGKKGPCFIASAVYGDPFAPEVNALRRFRDDRLRPYRPGRLTIMIYYRMSPPIASWLRKHKGISFIIRHILNIIARRY